MASENAVETSVLQFKGTVEKQSAFTTTHWTVVFSAAQRQTPSADVALEALCRTYWHPLFTHVRRRGFDVHTAQDLTQEFFSRLVEKDFLKAVDRERGRFRSFLLGAMEHFLANDWRRSHSQRRGGQYAFVSFDASTREHESVQAVSPTLSPDQAFDRQWAMVLLGRVLTTLQDEFLAAGKGDVFNEIKVYLEGEKHIGTYRSLAVKLGMNEGALKMTVSRLRRRYGELLRTEIRRTVSCPEEMGDEMQVLLQALSS